MAKTARAAVALLIALAAQPAVADPALLQRGRDIADGKCGRCHGTGATGESPHPLVLPLRAFSTRYPIDMISQALETGVVDGHDEMPMFDLGAEDARALVAYIDSLSPPDARYLQPRKP